MCVVSNIGDSWKEDFPHRWPQIPIPSSPLIPIQIPPSVSREEFDALRKEIEELKKLLKAGKVFDEATGQKHCEMEHKVKFIKDVAKLVGVDLGDVFDQSSE